ncbi:hypothetical protein QRX25_08330 [Bacillus sp. L381]|uniref:hypothetical protein n=2 Tax=Bacillus TaxID=1386 RepID=UPI001CA3C653|nr:MULTISPECIES: hypothetical protein [Bacillus]QZY13437.1 hypothetical protein K7B13_08285 [Bacillus amyloliquefaciens]WIX23249.1 hypothetical protein QRX25_08330 [Bacillus sp. L381]
MILQIIDNFTNSVDFFGTNVTIIWKMKGEIYMLKVRKSIFAVVFSAILLIPIGALAASYSPRFDFYHQFTTPNYSMGASNIKLTSHAQTGGKSITFKINVRRVTGWFSDESIGTKSFPGNATSTETYKNNKSGKYFLKFTKTNNGIPTQGWVDMRN